MEEIWKDVEGFEGRFRVSNIGRVISINGRCKGEVFMKTTIEKSTGYNQVVLQGCGKRIYERVHTLVAKHFVNGRSEINNCVNHLDGNKLNNHYTNLEWTTMGFNISHAYKMGLINANGEMSSNAKIGEFDVLRIRELAHFKVSRRKILKILQLPINERHVSDIINKVCWKSV